jgi:hypothetical protein
MQNTFDKRDVSAVYKSNISRQLLDYNIKKFWVSGDFVNQNNAILEP